MNKIGVIIDKYFTDLPLWQKYVISVLYQENKLFGLYVLDKQVKNKERGFFRFLLKLEANIFHLDNLNICDDLCLNVFNSLEEFKQFDICINLSSTCAKELKLADYDVDIIDIIYDNKVLVNSFYIGIKEYLRKYKTIDLSLMLYRKEYRLLDIVSYNTHWSCAYSSNMVKFSLANLLIKNLNVLTITAKTGKLKSNLLMVEDITLWEKNRYVAKFIFNTAIKYRNKIYNKIFKSCDGQNWTVFLGKGEFVESDLTQIKPLSFPKKEFWADPFLFKYNNDLYLFFERFPFKTTKGVISCTKILNDQITEVIDVLDLPYHLSYPNVFEEDGNIYMIPECSENNCLEVYQCVDFPNKWRLYSIGFEGESVADTVYYKDANGDKWLFISKTNPVISNHCNELWIYKIDSLKLKKIESHRKNPVIINSEFARNGGAIFNYLDHAYRVSQNNTYGMYGKGINISRIKELSINNYEEEVIRKVSPSFSLKLIGMHHMHQIDGFFVLDGRLR